EAEIDSGAGPTRIAAGELARLGRMDRFAAVESAGRPDSFDEWSRERERQMSGEESSRYVSREMVGYEDLDRYGTWESHHHYGYVWYPRVSAGWSPYHFGRWVWIAPWGWTWIDASPWGFAPFHYGRWAFVKHRWCWIPGPKHRRPVYGPAHVAWMGERYESSLRSPVGWLPLGPGEVYVPAYRASPRHLRNINVSNTAIANNAYITNVYRNRVENIRHLNRDAPGAFTLMPRDAFAGGKPVPYHGWRTRPENAPSFAPRPQPPDVEPLRRFRIHSGTARQESRDSTRLPSSSEPRGWTTPRSPASAENAHRYRTPAPRVERDAGVRDSASSVRGYRIPSQRAEREASSVRSHRSPALRTEHTQRSISGSAPP